jgi:synapsin
MVIAPDVPCVVKVSPPQQILGLSSNIHYCFYQVGHAHAGMGKQKVNDNEQFRDLATVIALYSDYCTAEKFIDVEYGIRVQKIGNSYRVLKKMMTGSGWKSQFGWFFFSCEINVRIYIYITNIFQVVHIFQKFH